MPAGELIARVVFDSPLLTLDREFEYSIPDTLVDSIEFGHLVKVQLGRSIRDAYVVYVGNEKKFSGELSQVLSVTSRFPLLSKRIYELAKLIAERQCCAVGEVLKVAIPKRFSRIENKFEPAASTNIGLEEKPQTKVAELVTAVAEIDGLPHFIHRIAELAVTALKDGRASLVIFPDFRDLDRFETLMKGRIESSDLVRVDNELTGSERFALHLRALDNNPSVIFGTRSAIYVPMPKNAQVIIWDESDQNHIDQQSPYLSTRDIAIMRNSVDGTNLIFLAHTRSTEIERLIQIGYLSEISPKNGWYPRVSLAEGPGLDSQTFRTIADGLKLGPVLVQVAAPGTARSLFCNICSARSACLHCHGPLWINRDSQIACRWCGEINLDAKCEKCGSRKFRQGASGSTGWARQLGKSFPNVQIREITSDIRALTINNKPQIVVSTAGIEPVAEDGYASVVLLDCKAQLSIDNLRAPELALQSWLNALAFMRSNGQAVAVGVSSEVAKALSLGQVKETIAQLYSERIDLGLPPAKRIMTATGLKSSVDGLAEILVSEGKCELLGIATSTTSQVEKDYRLLVRFDYRDGALVSSLVRQYLAKLDRTTVRTNSATGRKLRPLTIKFDDPKVI